MDGVSSSSSKAGALYAGVASVTDPSDVYLPIRESLGSANTDDFLRRQLYADLCVYLADDILVKVDRMSMATSLETRAPFLDVKLMDWRTQFLVSSRSAMASENTY
ncbi:MAG: hypothetical protein Ct9H300mP25_13780 [Acidobacteriota bacterium]|nr:MAG: hypothetical protein Ct9H300mP25_13780 [Acidobacteriota bacterium]